MNRLAFFRVGALTTLTGLSCWATSAHADDTGGTTTVPAPNTSVTTTTTTTTNANATASDEKITDVLENKGQSYYFLGLNYRVGVVPAFMINLFVDSGPQGVLGESTIGLSFDYRKDHFSMIPGINYSSYNMDPAIFIEKGKSGLGNTTVVSANMNALYVTVDLLWSVPIAKAGQVDFEFGFAVGLGGLWGDVHNTWVSDASTGAGSTAYKGQDGTTYYQCTVTGPNGCNASQHSNSSVNKVGSGKGYREPTWFDSGGGSVPNILPWIELPILGFRFKPIKELEMRFNTGFSLTGFFFNFAAYYGFENPKSTPK